MSGYIAMRRDWLDHAVFGGDPYSRRDAWAWLIANAAWKPTKARLKGTTVELQRGELCFSQRFLARKWRWSKSRVDRFLHMLRAEGMIATRSKTGATAGRSAGQGPAIIFVRNYDKFQVPLKGERGSPQTETGTTAGQQRGKEEEGKTPLSNDKGADAEKVFWENAKTYLKAHIKSDPGALIGKWLREAGKEMTVAALNAAQLEHAVDPIAYVSGFFRRHSQQAEAEESGWLGP